jgi:hypothetical protein
MPETTMPFDAEDAAIIRDAELAMEDVEVDLPESDEPDDHEPDSHEPDGDEPVSGPDTVDGYEQLEADFNELLEQLSLSPRVPACGVLDLTDLGVGEAHVITAKHAMACGDERIQAGEPIAVVILCGPTPHVDYVMDAVRYGRATVRTLEQHDELHLDRAEGTGS